MVGKKALCVGINKFQNLPQEKWLNGCVNDTADLITILKKYMSFADNEIVRLIDDQATKKNIMDNLTEMVNGAKAENMIIWYSVYPAMVLRSRIWIMTSRIWKMRLSARRTWQ
jgi:hypothetical protein